MMTSEGEAEERSADQQAAAAGLQRLLGGAVELHDLLAPRRRADRHGAGCRAAATGAERASFRRLAIRCELHADRRRAGVSRRAGRRIQRAGGDSSACGRGTLGQAYRSARSARPAPGRDRDGGAPDRRGGRDRSDAPIRHAAPGSHRGRAGSGGRGASSSCSCAWTRYFNWNSAEAGERRPGRARAGCRARIMRPSPAIGPQARRRGALGAAQPRRAGARIGRDLGLAGDGLVAGAARETGRRRPTGRRADGASLRRAARARAQEMP